MHKLIKTMIITNLPVAMTGMYLSSEFIDLDQVEDKTITIRTDLAEVSSVSSDTFFTVPLPVTTAVRTPKG